MNTIADASPQVSASLLITTYNWPDALEKVFWGLFAQTRRDFEVIIADDGSRPETGELIARMAARSPIPIVHVWQPDEGFGKCRILNKAMAVARGERIIVTDGDCVVRNDFVDTHLRQARPGRYLSGSYFKQTPETSAAIDEAAVLSQDAFTAGWLWAHGCPSRLRLIKVSARPPFDWLLNRLIQTKPSWNGHSASCLRSDAVLVNGFNEDMVYGGLDVEFGVRLQNLGLKGRRIRFSTVALHLHHERGYATPEAKEANARVKQRTREQKLIRCDRGVDQWLAADGSAQLHPDDRIVRYG